MGTRFEGVFLHGGSFNAITRATPGASLLRAPVLLLWPPSLNPFLPTPRPAPSSSPLILRRRHHPHNRHPPLPRPRTYFSSYFIFICFPPPIPSPSRPCSSSSSPSSPPPPPSAVRAPLPRRARHSALFSFYRQQSWLMQYPPPSEKPFLFCV